VTVNVRQGNTPFLDRPLVPIVALVDTELAVPQPHNVTVNVTLIHMELVVPLHPTVPLVQTIRPRTLIPMSLATVGVLREPTAPLQVVRLVTFVILVPALTRVH
jgi:hypothetical protein